MSKLDGKPPRKEPPGMWTIGEEVNQLLEGQTRIESKLDAVVEQTADLTEFRNETKESLSKITTEV